jgi:hypothetical protein
VTTQEPDILAGSAGGTAVRFIEEQGGAEKIFDFATMPVKPEVREWLVRVFACRIRPPRGRPPRRGLGREHMVTGNYSPGD